MAGLIDRVTERRRLSITQRLRRLPVWGHPALRVRFAQEGFNRYVFGCRAGPSISFLHLAHDLAHAVQFGASAFEKRTETVGCFRFKCRQVYVNGIGYDEPRTDQCTRRETETAAIELHLLEMAGVKTWRPRYQARAAAAFEFLPDWYQFTGANRVHDIGALMDFFHVQWTPERVSDELLAWLNAQGHRMLRRSVAPHIGEADLCFDSRPMGRSTPAQRVAASKPRKTLSA